MKQIAIIISLITLSCLIIYLLYLTSERPNKVKNSFTRRFCEKGIQEKQVIGLKSNIQGIAGMYNDKVYLSTDKPNELLLYTIRNMSEHIIHLPASESLKKFIANEFEVTLYYPYIFIISNNKKLIVKYSLTSNKTQSFLLNNLFTRSAVVSDSSLLIRSYNDTIEDQEITFVNLNNSEPPGTKRLTEIYGDGGIITDGMIMFDKVSQKAIYAYYYKNEIKIFNTAFDSILTYHTIDTFSSFNEKYFNDKKSPRSIVNKYLNIANDKIFIVSNLKSDNESENDFNNNIDLDIYDLNTGKYRCSFQIPEDKRAVIDLKIYGNNLFVLKSGILVSYKMTI